MAIRKFIEEIGEKVLPSARRMNSRPQQQQQAGGSARGGQLGAPHNTIGCEISDSAEAIRRYLLSRSGYTPPSDLVVLFDEDEGRVILGGTVRDDETRECIVQDAGNIQGVEKVDDRMSAAASRRRE